MLRLFIKVKLKENQIVFKGVNSNQETIIMIDDNFKGIGIIPDLRYISRLDVYKYVTNNHIKCGRQNYYYYSNDNITVDEMLILWKKIVNYPVLYNNFKFNNKIYK